MPSAVTVSMSAPLKYTSIGFDAAETPGLGEYWKLNA